MKKIAVANTILILGFGTLFLWPVFKNSVVEPSIEVAYNSVCMIYSGKSVASGVLLESGLILTASHVVDANGNKTIDDDEITVRVSFPALKYETSAIVLDTGFKENLDIAVLQPVDKIPCKGVRLIESFDYWNDLKIGTRLTVIGMQLGRSPANITDGRIIDMDMAKKAHRNSANSYLGNSGGGVFVGDKLIGISIAVGFDSNYTNIPIFDNKELVGHYEIRQNIPMANMSLHVSAPAVRNFLEDNHINRALFNVDECPVKNYFGAIFFNIIAMIIMIIIYVKLYKAK